MHALSDKGASICIGDTTRDDASGLEREIDVLDDLTIGDADSFSSRLWRLFRYKKTGGQSIDEILTGRNSSNSIDAIRIGL